MPFLIALHGRSGTAYATAVFQALGYDVQSEKWTVDGTVSWQHVPFAKRMGFSPVLHQVRDPLKTIGSTCTIADWAFRMMFDVIGDPPCQEVAGATGERLEAAL